MTIFCRNLQEAMRENLRLARRYRVLARTAPDRRIRCLMLKYMRQQLCQFRCNRLIFRRFCLVFANNG